MDWLMSAWGGKTKEELERSRRKLVYDLEEVNIKLQKRHPPSEVDKLEASKRKLEFQIQEIDEDLKNLALKEKEENDAHQREHDRITREHEESLRRNNERRRRNKERRKEKLKKYGMEASFEDSKEVLMPCCSCCVIL